jgi:cell division protein FtsN
MAARRGKKTQARRSGAPRGVPSLLWLLGALLLGAVLAGVVLMRDRLGDSLGMPKPNPAAKAPPPVEAPVAQKPAPKKPTYDFYKLLPEKEAVIPDAELTATARAERERPAATPAAPTSDSRYLLQAGAFSDSQRAEEVKAQIAFTGEFARVEAATINGKTVHRVMLGPYANAQSLESAKQKLSTAGIPSVAVRAR